MRSANFIVFLILARTLSMAELGYYGYLLSTLMLASVLCDLGLRQSIARHVGEDNDRAGPCLAQMIVAWLPLSLVAGLATVLAMRAFPSEGGWAAPDALLVTGAAAVLFVRLAQGVFLGLGRFGQFNRSELVSRAVLLVGVAVCWALEQLTLSTTSYLLIGSYLMAAMILLFEMRGLMTLPPLPDLRILRSLVIKGVSLACGVAAMIGFGRLTLAMATWTLGDEAAGTYFALMRLSEMVVEIAMAVGISLFSHGVRSSTDNKSARQLFGIAWAVTSFIAALIILLGWMAPMVLAMLLPSAGDGEIIVFRILLVAAIPSSLSVMLHPGLAARGMALQGAAIFMIGIGLIALIGGIAASAFGLLGLAWLYLATSFVVAFGFVWLYRLRFEAGLTDVLMPWRQLSALVMSRLGGKGQTAL
jgi:O-antigen/teichoic acid export membrane protein